MDASALFLWFAGPVERKRRHPGIDAEALHMRVECAERPRRRSGVAASAASQRERRDITMAKKAAKKATKKGAKKR
jgi:hypothetical protein